MISNYWFINDHGTFKQTREKRVGASELPACIPSPENPTESLAGYNQTALTVYEEKLGLRERDPAGLPAEMGHHNENKTLELVIRYFWDREEGLRFRLAKERFESDCELARLGNKPEPSARGYQTGGPFLHSVQYFTDGMIAHPDMLFIGIPELKGKKERFVTYEGVRMDLSKPWNVESKNANHYAVKRPHGSIVKGYNFDLMTWHGIPFKHYIQMQFQHNIFKINTGLLALMSDSADFHIWKIEADKKVQGKIMDIVGKMVKHIELKTMPRELAMNLQDVITMIPEIKEDFIDISGWPEEQKKLLMKSLNDNNYSKLQQKNWKKVDIDSNNAVAVLLNKYGEIRNGSVCLAKWSFRKPSESISKPEGTDSKDSVLSWIKKNKPSTYRTLQKNGLIKESKGSRYVSVKWKGEE